jgi:hypothetical protein
MIRRIAENSLLEHCWNAGRAESWPGGDKPNIGFVAPPLARRAKATIIGCSAG